MSEESPTPGSGAGLAEGIEFFRTTTTAEPSAKFQPASEANKPKRFKPRSRFAGRRRAFVLLHQVQCLARWRRAQGVVHDVLDERQFVWVMAKILAGMPPCLSDRVRLNGLRNDDPRHGLDFYTLTRAIADAGFGSLSEAELITIIHDVQDWHDEHPNCPINGRSIGKALNLTALERHEVRCWNITAIDESRKEREATQKAKKREAARKRMQHVRRGRHTPQAERQAEAEKRRAFCREHDISDRTFRRWIKNNDQRVRFMFACDISNKIEQTRTGHQAKDAQSIPFTDPARTDRQTLSGSAGVASQPGPVSLGPKPQDVRPQPSWATDGLSLGMEVERTSKASVPALHEHHNQEANAQFQLFENEEVPEKSYLPPSDVRSFRRRMGYSQAELSRRIGIRSRSQVADFEGGHKGLSRHRQRFLKYMMASFKADALPTPASLSKPVPP